MTRAALRGFGAGLVVGLAFYAGHVLSLFLLDRYPRRWL